MWQLISAKQKAGELKSDWGRGGRSGKTPQRKRQLKLSIQMNCSDKKWEFPRTRSSVLKVEPLY